MKKQLVLGLTAGLALWGLGAAATTAHAATKTLGPYQALKSWGKNRHVIATGTNALYTQPGYLKSARVVAPKRTMARLGGSSSSADIFFAYGARVVSNGSVYYRVVTMNKRYRGYVYGGKTLNTFAQGVAPFKTVKKLPLPTNAKESFRLKNVHQNPVWRNPQYTWYGMTQKETVPASAVNDSLTIIGAEAKTREGSTYYLVTGPHFSGWVYAGGLVNQTAQAVPQNADTVHVVYQTADHQTVGNKNYTLQTTRSNPAKQYQTSFLANQAERVVGVAAPVSLTQFVQDNVPTGYQLNELVSKFAILSGQFINLNVIKRDAPQPATSPLKLRFTSIAADSSLIQPLRPESLTAGFPKLTAQEQKGFTGPTGKMVSLGDLPAFQAGGKLNQLYSYTLDAETAHPFHYVYTFAGDSTDGSTGQADQHARYGQVITAYYHLQRVAGVAPTQNFSGNTDYLF
ncbi:hypothetical protein [Levilactobacillus acidifarinae]|uniref:GW domain-containing protein n=1 Tax=Levilactobacillus acidifarinae DSM 19394 = JCM 15949 TaxID=1423715 RepID=A0A0R1LJK1_9LACO|nr:hypothetical protein [Levilactobacillus acidifarinae]KRK95957.1 hypothetical protein FD25_GL002418 [Levilactobacillus acidifarinae DSM 19394]GEO69262.1 hypothetical protein LAC03_11720 [Levilactobacillus acidifarinae]